MSAGEQLEVMLESTEAPLVFSNGDLNPSNFLSDGRRLTGIVDFGGSCWEDPLFGFAMCARVRWQAFDGEDLARRWAVRRGFTPVALEIRMALACMRRLVELEIVSTPLAALRREQVRERLRAACSNFP